MKLVLTNFSQDVSLSGEAGQQYAVFQDEDTGRVFRLPAAEDLIVRLSQILMGDFVGEPPMPGDEPQPTPEEEAEAEARTPRFARIEEPVAENLGQLDPGTPPNTEPLPEEEPPKPPVKKRLVVPGKLQAVRERIAAAGTPTDDGVPNL